MEDVAKKVRKSFSIGFVIKSWKKACSFALYAFYLSLIQNEIGLLIVLPYSIIRHTNVLNSLITM